VVEDGEAVAVGGPKARALLARLIWHAPDPVSVDQLMEAMWGESPPKSAVHAISVYASRLRSVLPDGAIASVSGGYRLAAPFGEVDRERFDELCTDSKLAVQNGDTEKAAAVLRTALDIWRGPAFDDLRYNRSFQDMSEQLEETRLQTLEDWFDLELTLGHHRDVLGEIAAHSQGHPLRERIRGQLMLALYRAGRQAEALAVLTDLRELLKEELGMEPSPDLADLEVRILQQDPALRHEAQSPSGADEPVTLESQRTNLPSQATPFIGRQQETAAITELLGSDEVRLVTLTGPGGIGKTRLSLQVAADLLDEFHDGAVFVELASIADSGLVGSVIAGTFGITTDSEEDSLKALVGLLAKKEMLLVIDNFEHVIDAAPLVGELIAGAPAVKVLTSSREVLRVYGEHEYPVPPLGLPEDSTSPTAATISESEAVSLFIQRARAAQPSFEIDETNAATIAEICRRLDGLPLAIELAAARVRLFDTETLLARLSDSLKTLTGGARDLPSRLQTIRGAIEWSYDWLDENEQTLFARLGVFRSGRSGAAVETVGGPGLAIDVWDGLESLLNKNLLRRDDGPEGEARFVMLETIHAYASERLADSDEADDIHKRHAEFFAALAEQASTELAGQDQHMWLNRLTMDYENLRKAMEWALDGGDVPTGLRIVAALGRYWRFKNFLLEGHRWGRRALTVVEQAPEPVQGQVFQGAAYMEWMVENDQGEATRLYERSLVIDRKSNNHSAVAETLIMLGYTSTDPSDVQIDNTEEGIALAREIGDQSQVAHGLNVLGEIYKLQGRYEEARQAYEEALPITRQTGNRLREGMLLDNLGMVAFLQDDFEQAKERRLEYFKLALEIGDNYMIAHGLAFGGGILGAAGQPERGARLLGAGAAQGAAIGSKTQTSDQPVYDKLVAVVRDQLDNETFDRLWAEGEALSLEEAIELRLQED